MLKKSQIEIINLFRKNIFLERTIREISLILKKDYPNVHQAIKELSKQKIIQLRKAGNSQLCTINLSNPLTITTLSFLEEQESFSKKIPNIEKILEFKEFLEDITIITGSYANGKQTPKSDLDLVIITQNKVFDKQKLIENLTALMLPKIHPIAVSNKDFVGMLLDKKENYGKEISKNHLVFRNSSRYYQLIKSAIENGFRG
ncbi:MAG: nucleotidyltransferase domain-containing protein [Nanoarchaeota archaeon]